MPIFRLRRELAFPDPALAEPEGLLAVGGDLSPERLILAYQLGIFPWYAKPDPILWWSPDPRLVLEPKCRRVSRSLAKTIRSGRFRVTADTAFAEVIGRCGAKPRPDQDGTWITNEMRDAYIALHDLGVAHSIETRTAAGELVGGLYGVSLGGVFFGESMFSDVSDASKVAFIRLLETLESWGFDLVDCQMDTPHLRRFGAVPIPRKEFLTRLAASLAKPPRQGRWVLGE